MADNDEWVEVTPGSSSGDWEEVKPGDGGGDWEEVKPSAIVNYKPKEHSTLEAMARAYANAYTWGTADKIGGAIGAVRDYWKDPNLHGLEGLKEAYRLNQAINHDYYQEAEDQHPYATFAGMLPGAALAPGGSLFAPARAAEGATIGAKAANAAMNLGKAAGAGAVYGAGSSQHNVLEEPGEFAKDVAFGAGGGMVGHVAGNAIVGTAKAAAPLIVRGGGKIGKKLGQIVFGTPEWAAEQYMEHPDQVSLKSGLALEPLKREIDDDAGKYLGKVDQAKESLDSARSQATQSRIDAQSARRKAEDESRHEFMVHKEALSNVRPPEQLASDIMSHLDDVAGRKISEGSGKSFDILSKGGHTFSVEKLVPAVDKQLQALEIGGLPPRIGPQATAYKVLSSFKNQIEDIAQKYGSRGSTRQVYDPTMLTFKSVSEPGSPGQIPAEVVKKLIQNADSASRAAYQSEAGQMGGREVAESIAAVRSGFNNALREASEPFAAEMDKLAPMVDLSSRMSSLFGQEAAARNSILAAGNQKNVRGLLSRKLLQEYDAMHGTDFVKQIDQYAKAQGILRSPTAMDSLRKSLPGAKNLSGELPEEVKYRGAENLSDIAQKELDKAKEVAAPLRRLGPGSTESAIRSVGRGRNFEGRDALEYLGQLEDKDFVTKVRNLAAKQAFEISRTNGSRRAVAGNAIAGVPGVVAMMGLDEYGGRIYQGILSGALKVGQLGKFAGPLFNAAKRGSTAFAATHALLMRKSPEYRALVQSQTQEDNQ